MREKIEKILTDYWIVAIIIACLMYLVTVISILI